MDKCEKNMNLARDSVRQSSDNKNKKRKHMGEKKDKKPEKKPKRNHPRNKRRLLPFLPFSQLQNTVSCPPPKMC